MSRSEEVTQVEESLRIVWLAGQLDEVERTFVNQLERVGTEMHSLSAELASTRQQMSANTTKMLVAISTASITLLVSVIAWVATVVIGK